jgi:hypothetical protein
MIDGLELRVVDDPGILADVVRDLHADPEARGTLAEQADARVSALYWRVIA